MLISSALQSTCKIDRQYVEMTDLPSESQCQSCNPEKSVYKWTIIDVSFRYIEY